MRLLQIFRVLEVGIALVVQTRHLPFIVGPLQVHPNLNAIYNLELPTRHPGNCFDFVSFPRPRVRTTCFPQWSEDSLGLAEFPATRAPILANETCARTTCRTPTRPPTPTTAPPPNPTPHLFLPDPPPPPPRPLLCTRASPPTPTTARSVWVKTRSFHNTLGRRTEEGPSRRHTPRVQCR